MTKDEARAQAAETARKGVSRGMMEINATHSVGCVLAAELRLAGYVVEHKTVYRGRQRLEYERAVT